MKAKRVISLPEFNCVYVCVSVYIFDHLKCSVYFASKIIIYFCLADQPILKDECKNFSVAMILWLWNSQF